MSYRKRTIQQVETAKDRAVRFMRDVLGDDQRADEIEGESLDDYAERKHILVVNPADLSNLLALKNAEIELLKQGLLEIGEIIDESDQSRLALSRSIDAVRKKAVELYGESFESDLSDFMDVADDEDFTDFED